MDDDFLKGLNEELKKQQDIINQTSIEDFDNLSPEDMFNIVYKPFQEECPIQYKAEIGIDILNDIPFLNLVEYYLNSINTLKEIKLTTRGNLPTKLVKEYYELGFIKEEMIERGLKKLYKEDDSKSIINVKLISELAGFAKKRNNKLSLTQNGVKHLGNEYRKEVLQLVFEAYGYKFNLGYHDGYQDQGEVQRTLGYLIYLLLKYGDEERELDFYSTKILTAYPHLISVFTESYTTSERQFNRCFSYRIFESFLNWFNLIEVRKEREFGNFDYRLYVKNKHIHKIFEIRNDKFKFRKGKFYA
ncbi:MAG: hypothetical protein WAU01_05220 [Saprospiraceae bacterium]